MSWYLKHGKHLQYLLNRESEGHDIQELKDRPVLYPDLYLDWQAFSILSQSRQLGFSVGPIPLSEIHAYMQIMDIHDADERRRFLRHVTILDHVYLEWQNKQTEKNKKKKR